LAGLAAASTDIHFLVIATGERVNSVSEWLEARGINVQRVYSLDNLGAFGLTFTPTILIIDRSGRVTDIMMRQLDEVDQTAVLRRLRDPEVEPLDNSRKVREVSIGELDQPSLRHAQLIDIRSRELYASSHRPKARNLPSAELASRAPIELDQQAPVVVDCLQPGADACSPAAWRLADLGFQDVFILIR
jgi:rhodanese-related sulfurtransferase